MKITVREMAEQLGVSVSAIYQHINRNPEVKEHIEKEGRRVYIDDIGQDIIRKNSIATPNTSIMDNSTFEELSNLKKENEELRKSLDAVRNEYFDFKNAHLKASNLIENQKKDLQRLESNVEERKNENKELLDENIKLQVNKGIAENEIKRLEEELEKEKNKTWWDKFRGK